MAAPGRGGGDEHGRVPQDAVSLALLARSQLADDAAEALASADRAVAADPDLALAHQVRAEALRALERVREAVQAAGKAAAVAPDSAAAHRTVAVCLLELHLVVESQWLEAHPLQKHQLDGNDLRLVGLASRHARRAVALAPDDPDGHVLEGDVLLRSGNRRQAQVAYQRALALAPDHAAAGQGLAVLTQGGNVAVYDAVAAVTRAPHSRTAVRYLRTRVYGWLYAPMLGLGMLLVPTPLPLIMSTSRLVGLVPTVFVVYGVVAGRRVHRSLARLPPVARAELGPLLRRPATIGAALLLASGTILVTVALVFASLGHDVRLAFAINGWYLGVYGAPWPMVMACSTGYVDGKRSSPRSWSLSPCARSDWLPRLPE